MNCLYCRHVNSEDEPRCQRCGRRLATAPARPAPENYVSTYVNTQATALAMAVQEAPAPARTESEVPPPPQRAQVPRQTRLFTETEKVLQFPQQAKPQEPRQQRVRRHSAAASENQGSLDFLPPAPHAPRTLKTSVEAVIYCDAPVATPMHRAVASALDFGIVFLGFGVFLVTYLLCGGGFAKMDAGIALGFGGAFLAIAFLYGFLWVLTGSGTAGGRWTGLRLINFDGTPIDRRERAIRFAAACLSFLSAGLGVLWSLADEESLTWHDHMSKTFPTIRT